jgi:surface polysaccharide O-acyltransferase-like enzyme
MSPDLSKSDSEAIKIARVLCILSMIYVHMPPYYQLFTQSTVVYNDYLWIIRDAIGRTSVPLLSVISGYFVAQMLAGQSWAAMVIKKVKTLIVPLVLWNLIYLTVELIINDPHITFPLAGLPNNILALTAPSVAWPFYFLRDMFVCSLISPLFIWLGQKALWPSLAALIVVALTGIDGPVFINNMIPVFFFFGLMVFSGKLNRFISLREQKSYLVVAAGVIVAFSVVPIVLAAMASQLAPLNGNSIRVLFIRFAGSLVFWALALYLIKQRIGQWLIKVEPFIFFVFCLHQLIATMIWRFLFIRSGLDQSPLAVIAYFIAGPMIVLIITIPAVWVGTRIWPQIMRWLGGGRIPSNNQWHALFASMSVRAMTAKAARPNCSDEKM